MSTSRRARRITAYAFLACALASTLVPLLPTGERLPIWKHHLVHGLVLGLAGAAGLFFAHQSQPNESHGGTGAGGWVIVTVFMPVFSMFLMWPTTYDWLEQHPLAHGAEHLCFVALGFLATYSGEKYVAGVGWISGVATVLTAIVAAGGFGVVVAK